MDNWSVVLYDEEICKQTPLATAEETPEEDKKMEGVLHSHFREQVHPYLELIDSLRLMGIDKDLSLPAIAVIGDQSSGKSSVLEALSGVALPRGSGIVTRCPLMLRLRKVMGLSEWKGTVSYKNETKDIKDPAKVGDYVVKAQNELAGNGVGICDELISLEIMSPEVCDLTLIDLPGIARVPVKGQPHDIGDQIKRLIHRFIANEETINLVVVPCNVDIATTEALRMAQEVDPDGKRTLAILTKPDLVDCGTEKNILDIVDNRVIPLSKGYIVVKCRGQQQIQDGIPLAEATRMERDFFSQHKYFRRLLDEGKATTQCLTIKLTQDLVGCIKNFLPTLSEQIKKELCNLRELLSQYPVGPPIDAQKRRLFLTRLLIEFNNKINRLIEVCEKVQNVVKEYDLKHRGKELPGFSNYDVFETVTQDAVAKLQNDALQTLREIRGIVEKQFNEVSKSCFRNYPFLECITTNKINKIQSKQEAKMEKRIQEQFEMEKLIYTQDGNFFKTIKTIDDFVPPPSPQQNVSVEENLSKTPQTPSKRGRSPCRKSAKRPRHSDQDKPVVDLPSMTDMDANPISLQATISLEASAISSEAMSMYPKMLHSYYEIMIQRQADQIPMLIQYFLLKKSAEMLCTEMLSLTDGVDVDKALSEVSDSSRRRSDLQGRVERLSEAQDKLSHFL
ncbi:interferon-induced GTP-binding protein Mx1-like isoform X3 [Alosa sapidissima]|uniref:interferon-induced GTP-binding protein Mx1-like isoform X3 n=1 Tax=Alosa sapidissima TaxID=34773 RepID=UPI001C0A1E48|nr:interferon-induced GTP-binding protein Mx1-like isoform X3 [Alosa sapidissima]XP_041950640.1 interferon-induced GTP-binding protein Mx1-like isoform X3 [Alosa sapidissima]